MKLLSILLLFFFLNTGFNAEEKELYTISIKQDATLFSLGSADTLYLKPQTFSFLVGLNGIEGFYLSASFDPYYHNLKEEEQIRDWEYIESKAFVDASFNPDKELLIADDGLNYWFHDPGLDWNRFDPGIKVDGKRVNASRTVSRLWDADASRPIALKSVHKPIYLFTFYREPHSNPKKCRAIERKKLVLIFKR